MRQVSNLREGYHELARWVRDEGEAVAPRGFPTREVLGATFEVCDTVQTMPVGCGRGVNPAIGTLEALFLIGGFVDYNLVKRIAPRFQEFMDDGKLHGAYGARSHGFMQHIVRRLRSDSDTRQAVIALWHPEKDLPRDGLHDYPCTLTLHFMLRRDALNMHVTMRSNDLWLGTALDVFMFTQLQHTLARALGVETGRYFHTANSLHLYDRDLEKVEEMLGSDFSPESFMPRGIDVMQSHGSWEIVESAAHLIAEGAMQRTTSESVRWYHDRLHPKEA